MIKRAKNIARKFILLATMLLIGYCYALAQNSPTAPYINSTHLYQVPMGNISNTVLWQISNPNYSGGTPLTLEAQLWVTTNKIDDVVDLAEISIKFVNTPFNGVAGIWTLRYEEWDETPGTGNCIAVRSMEITPVANDFSLVCGADDLRCNSWSDEVFPNDVTITDPEKGQVDFTVTMSKNLLHLVKQWSFSGTIQAVGTNYENPIASEDLFDALELSSTTTYGTYDITWTSGNSFTATVTIDVDDLGYVQHASDILTFTANIKGPPTSQVAVTLTIANGQAISGSNSHIRTDENGFDAGDDNQTLTRWAIPATSVIVQSD